MGFQGWTTAKHTSLTLNAMKVSLKKGQSPVEVSRMNLIKKLKNWRTCWKLLRSPWVRALSQNQVSIHFLMCLMPQISLFPTLGSSTREPLTIWHILHKSLVLTALPSNKKIATADGSLTTVAGQKEVHLDNSIVLKIVLHIPKLSTNLVSIHRLTKDLNCHVIFHPFDYVFQDQGLGKTIGHAREKDGLYHRELPFDQNRPRTGHPYHSSPKFHPPKETRSGSNIIVLDIHHSVLLRLCFLYCSKGLM